jgi:hypothetical protein
MPRPNPTESVDERYRRVVQDQRRAFSDWIDRAGHPPDVWADFLFVFIGFNSLYFAWSYDASTGECNGEGERDWIHRALRGISESRATEILESASELVSYLRDRGPLQDMRHRVPTQPNSGRIKGRGNLTERLTTGKPSDRLLALGDTVYWVRCNLVHGGKSIDAENLNLVRLAYRPLLALAKGLDSALEARVSGGSARAPK